MVLIGLALLIIAGGISFFLLKGEKKQEAPQVGGALEEENNVLPSVDASVKVELSSENGREAVLAVSGIPEGTESIDYELSYEEKTKGLQGVIGVMQVSGKNEAEKKITLGTCSSGRCVYHDVTGKIKVSLKFSGSYGEKIFEKEYDI